MDRATAPTPAISVGDTATHPAARRGAGAFARRFGIRAKLLALVGATTLGLAAAAGVGIYGRLADARRAMDTRALEVAHQVATTLDEHIAGVNGTLVALSQVVATDPRSRTTNDSVLGSVAGDPSDSSLFLFVWSPDGRVIGTSLPDGDPMARLAVGSRRFFRRALSGETPTFSTAIPVPGRPTRHALAIARPIVGPDGRVRAVIAAAMLTSGVQQLLGSVTLPNGSVTTLVSRDGVILARTVDAGRWIGRPVLRSARGVRMRARGTGVMEVRSIDGVERLSAFAPTSRAPWQVYVGIPTSVARGPVQAEFARAVVVGLLVLLGALWLTWLVATHLSGPLRTLATAATELGAGDLSRRVAVRSRDEIGALGVAFNQMADALAAGHEALRLSETRYRTMFEVSPLPMAVYDADSLQMLAVNAAALRLYGYSREEFLQLTAHDLLHPEHLETFPDFQARTSRQPRSRVWRHVRRDGSIVPVRVNSDTTIVDGRAVRVAVADDISEQLAAEEALRASEERIRLAQRMEAVGQLAGGIAHDFNNLLTVIGTSTDLARATLPAESPAAEDLEHARAAVDRASVLTRQLLAFSRQQMLEPRPLSLSETVGGLEGMLRRLLDVRVRLVLALDPALPPALADAGAVEQVIINLVLNARDAMPDGGELRITTTAVRLDRPLTHAHGIVAAGDYVALSVRDDGTGMAPETLTRIFEPFFTTKPVGAGTGLGLAMTHGIVHQLEGTITVRSAPGRGTTVTAYFPTIAWDATLAAPPPQPVPAPGLPPCTVLVVEDEPGVRTVARRILERAGHRVLTASSAEDALAQIDAGALASVPAVVLTDLVMPGMGGRALGERLATTYPELPVLYMSGYTDDELFRRGLAGEGHRLLHKPFTAQALLDEVARAAHPRPPVVEAA